MIEELQWHLVYTEPKSEKESCEWLRRQGFGSFVPTWTKLYRKQRKGTLRLKEQELPVFPGYVFVAQPIGAGRYKAIEETRGVLSLIRIDGSP